MPGDVASVGKGESSVSQKTLSQNNFSVLFVLCSVSGLLKLGKLQPEINMNLFNMNVCIYFVV